jgi:hypothetical protein
LVREIAATFDSRTGLFSVKGLNAARSYDLYVELKDGTSIEGVALRPALDDRNPLPDDGREAIEKHFYGMKQFTNENRILALAGNGKSAAALVELARTTAFHAGGGDVIWRIERWDYLEEYGTWKKSGDQVLRRCRMSAKEWKDLRRLFVPAWGGLKPGQEVRLTVPKPAEAVGQHPESKPPAAPTEPQATPKKKRTEDAGESKDPDLFAP